MQIQIKEVKFSLLLNTQGELLSYVEYIQLLFEKNFNWVNRVTIKTSFYGLGSPGLTIITIKKEGEYFVSALKKSNDIYVFLFQIFGYIGALSHIFKKKIEITCKFQ